MSDTGLYLQRPNLIVADLDRALSLYESILGFRREFIKGPEPDSYSYPVFSIPEQAVLRFCVLSANDEQPRSLSLTEVTGIELPPMPVPRRNALVLRVEAYEEVCAAVQAAGLQMFPEEVLKTNDGRQGRETAFIDHDGHVVLIYRIDESDRRGPTR